MGCHFSGQKVKGQGHRGQMSAFLAFSRVRFITQKLFDGLQPYVAQTQTISRRCVAYHFEVKRSKVKVTAAFGSWMNMQFIAIFSCPLCSSARISWIDLISGTNTNHEWTMCHVTFPGQKVKGQGHRGHQEFGACPLCSSVRISWIYFISGTNTNHEWTMCRVTFPGQKVKGQGHRGHRKHVRSVARCIFHGLTSYVAQIQTMSGRCVW